MSQIESLVDHGRSLGGETMVDQAVVSRPGVGPPVLNTTTGILTPAASTVVHSGPCRVKMPTAQEQQAIFGDVQVTTTRFIIELSHDAPLVLIGDNITVSSEHDPHMAVRRFRVAATDSRTAHMLRHLGVEVVE